MIYNVLNGNDIAYSFPDNKIDGEIIMDREALIEGNLSGENPPLYEAHFLHKCVKRPESYRDYP